jgi:hypothetical protein
MRYLFVCMFIIGLATLISAQEDRCSALNENPCLEGTPIVFQTSPQYPGVIQFVPPGYMGWQVFNEAENGRPAPMFLTDSGYGMDISGITGAWGFYTEVTLAGCVELRVDGDFYVETDDPFGEYFDFTLEATLWEDRNTFSALESVSILEIGGSTGNRWVFYVGSEREITVRVAVHARGEPNAGDGSVIEWRRIAVNAIDEEICERQGVPVYYAPEPEISPEEAAPVFQAG